MRNSHILRENRRCEVPRYLVFVDTEAKRTPIRGEDSELQTLWFGVARYVRIRSITPLEYTVRGEIVFTDAGEFWRWVVEKSYSKTRVYVFAHNWQYDAALLDVEILTREMGFSLDRMYIDKGLFIVDVRRSELRLSLRDSFSYLMAGVDDLGTIVGIEKISMPSRNDSMDTWIAYCRRDVEIVERAMLEFIRFIVEHDLGNFANTLAAQALTAYRHRFMSCPIVIHDRDDFLEAERSAYHGGRVEAFRVGEIGETLYVLDVNSMYPAVMRDNDYPIAPMERLRRISPDEAREVLTRYGAIAYVALDTDVPAYPKRMNGRLVFPVGRFYAWLCTPELVYALEHQHIYRVERMFTYRMSKLFTDFVDYFYTLRREYSENRNTVYAYITKILMNALYGKFGERLSGWETVDYRGDVPDGIRRWYGEDPQTGDIVEHRRVFDVVQQHTTAGETYSSSPAIAAHVTAYARMALWHYMEVAGRENVHYVDTDCLFVNAEGYKNLSSYIDESRLGYLKLEGISRHSVIYAPKDYVLEGKARHKGVRSDATQVGDNAYTQLQFMRWTAMVHRGITGGIIVRNVTRHLTRTNEKGIVCAGGIVTPFVLSEF